MAAQRLPRGRAVGVDVWSTKDQSGNAEQVTRQNAELEGVADRVELHTADMRKLPFDDGSFDVVVSSLAIHNVPGCWPARRRWAKRPGCSRRAASWRSSTSDTRVCTSGSSRPAG